MAQQLFLADMHKAATVATRPAPPSLSPPWPPGRPVTHRQLVAFKMPPDLSRGRGVVPAPRDPDLAAALIVRVEDYAERVGWHWQHTRVVRASIRVLLGLQDTPGAPIATTEAIVLSQLRLPVRSALEVLAEVGMVEDDRTPRIVDWFNREASGLPAPMTREVQAWFQILHEGHATPPRAKPRSPTTIKLYTRAIIPALHTWARAGHESLREITRTDILAVLPPPGPDRALCGRGLGSLFRTLKTHKLIFTNPAQRLGTRHDDPIVLPADDLDPIREALNSADPARAALASLVAFHGLRTGDLRHLTITDIADRRITLDDRVIPLAPAVQQRVRALIDHRNQRWPTTINPHLFIHFRTARRTDPVGNRWIKLTLDLPGGVRALRRDRILDEAAATAGDTRRVSDLFGLSVQQASRYTDPINTAPSLPPPD